MIPVLRVAVSLPHEGLSVWTVRNQGEISRRQKGVWAKVLGHRQPGVLIVCVDFGKRTVAVKKYRVTVYVSNSRICALDSVGGSINHGAVVVFRRYNAVFGRFAVVAHVILNGAVEFRIIANRAEDHWHGPLHVSRGTIYHLRL